MVVLKFVLYTQITISDMTLLKLLIFTSSRQTNRAWHFSCRKSSFRHWRLYVLLIVVSSERNETQGQNFSLLLIQTEHNIRSATIDSLQSSIYSRLLILTERKWKLDVNLCWLFLILPFRYGVFEYDFGRWSHLLNHISAHFGYII